MRSCLTILTTLTLSMVFTLGPSGCSDDDVTACTEEGASEPSGPKCCAGETCGRGTEGWTPRTCKKGVWVCDHAVPEDACASPQYACTPIDFCGKVGIGSEEPDPAPDLCCVGGCTGTKTVHRVCKTGTQWECPGEAVSISACKDYKNACGGVLAKYRAGGFKLP